MNKILLIFLLTILPYLSDAANYSYSPQKGMTFAWQYDDAIAIFTDDGTRIKLWAVNGDGNSSDFSAYGWGMELNFPYTAYSPCTNNSGYNPDTFLPMTYAGQQQAKNDDASHLAQFDYMKSQRTYSTSTALHFDFQHLGSVIRYEITMPETVTLTNLTLNTDTPISLSLGNINVAANGTLVAYMMVPPMQFADGKVSVTLQDKEGREVTMNIEATEIVAGKCYPVELTCPEFDAEEPAKAQVLMAKTSTAKPIAHTTAIESILYPTATTPDFPIDEEHPMQQEVKKLLGDVNDDGMVMVNDAVLLINYYLQDKVSELDPEVCDVNGDGIINVADAVAIVNIYLKSE